MAAEKINHTHPLFVHPSDTPSSILIPVKLTGSENYGLWRRSMKIALQAKRKLGFVLGTCKKDSFKFELHEDWETCNAIVLSWIMNIVSPDLLSGIVYASNAHLVWEDLRERFDKVNRVRIFQLHREIATIAQGTESVSAYFTRLKELWAEYDAMVPVPNSKEYVEHLQHQRLMQFLSGLNETYEQVRHQILMKTMEPTLNQAYALIIEDESQNASTHTIFPNRGDLVAMQAGRGQAPMQNIRGQYKGKKPFLKCDYCNKPGHSKENCYKLVGYPTDFKAKQPYAANMTTGGQENGKQAGQDEEGSSSDGLKVGSYFTEDQYRHILNMLNRETPEHQANMAVSKLTRQLCCSVNFFPDFCLFHDLYNGKVRGIGRERGGLYILKKNFKGDLERFVKEVKKFASATTTQNNVEVGVLWHKRPGHASVSTMKKLYLFHNNSVGVIVNNDCPSKVKVVRTDNGTEFFNRHMNELFDAYVIVHQSSCVYFPQQNGIVERKHGHILDTARALKFQANTPTRFWGECIKTTVYVINRLPTDLLNGKAPYELLHNRTPSLTHLRVFGCLCYATNLVKEDKFSPRAIAVVFLGYAETQKGNKLMDLNTNKFFVCRDVIFKENMFSFQNAKGQITTDDTPGQSEPLQGSCGNMLQQPEVAVESNLEEPVEEVVLMTPQRSMLQNMKLMMMTISYQKHMQTCNKEEVSTHQKQ
ncbi:PREDICTED: uncharacterized protein LOC109222244, partial [Nicotiana attenuata]